MTSGPFEDAVAIDTNVFVHLLNPQNNQDRHINGLLGHLAEQRIALLVDGGGRIIGEYNQQLRELSGQDDRDEIHILRYWALNAPRRAVPVSGDDALMTSIRRVIVEQSETVDRIFVYVALKEGKVLISNDERHIVTGPPRERGQTPRRNRILNNTRRLRPDGADIMSSWEAYEKI